MRAGSLCALFLCAAACTDPTSAPRYPGFDPRPLSIEVTTDPAAAADGVARDAVLRATFDDYLDPDTVSFGPVTLKSGRGNFDADLRIDFVGRALVVRPRALLLGNSTYELVIQPTVASLSGRTVGELRTFRVDIGATVAGPRPERARVTWFNAADPASAIENLIGACAEGCHTTVGCAGEAHPPNRGLDLHAPQDSLWGLLNVPSVGLRGGPRPLLRVAPYDAARSVLLRKLIGGGAVRDSQQPEVPDLRVDGRRMPQPGGCSEVAPFDETRLRLVQDWIDGGALLN